MAVAMKIPYLDLSVRDQELKADLLAAVDGVLTHGRIVLGPEVERFEDVVARESQKQHAVGVGSGSDALYLALRSLGVGPGDEVITTAMSWIATANAVTLCGATPVFVDVREDLNIDPEAIERAITPRTKVLLPVHFTGKLCDMGAIMAIAQRHRLTVVEDAAQAFTAELDGRRAGSWGLLSCFSMNAMKVWCSYGEAGAVATDDAALRERLVSLRYAGTINAEDCHWPSINGRLHTLQAAMLLANFPYLEDRIERRRAVARFYSEALSDVVLCPHERVGERSVYYTYTIAASRRQELQAHLTAHGIETKVRHPILMPRHTAYRHLETPALPLAERLVQEILCLPAHEGLTSEETEYIAECIRRFYRRP